MKIAVTGKGGVGKSTLSVLMARILSESGYEVLLIDADPDMNAAAILGVPEEKKITPIVELKALIAERTGTKIGEPAPFFSMNPKVNDIPEKYCIEHRGIKLLVMGTVKKGGGGCACPENAFLKSLLLHLVISRTEWIILDMEAGIEHLGRGTALGVDTMIVVVEPSRTSIETAFRIKKLSEDILIKNIKIVGNKIMESKDKEFITEKAGDFDILGFISSSEEIRKINTGDNSIFDLKGSPVSQIKELIEKFCTPV